MNEKVIYKNIEGVAKRIYSERLNEKYVISYLDRKINEISDDMSYSLNLIFKLICLRKYYREMYYNEQIRI